ncbi:hypothetical protein VCHA38P217_110045 [Vibrio chagasii]|nr:hypothetical protein VCHA36O157_120097 [Vibrio chagasii]CAH6818224.1 hypothetical protein VCHA34P115_150045 [Vibrio chagasii]CAH6933902.1 hypothetical protein VCHA37P193_140045 [Vibrio chagasii]CAH6936813.1 hypothetical protein VCHA43O270_110045 [Vibrio chagasii]CAH6963438.1 hypothetical protein VCHA41O249_150046 [Vibrio chagasii]
MLTHSLVGWLTLSGRIKLVARINHSHKLNLIKQNHKTDPLS